MASSVPTASGFAFFTQVYPQQSGTVVSGPYIAQNGSPVMEAFLKGEPRALGTVQIMIGGIYILFGIVMAIYADSIGIFSGIYFWGGIIYIVSGALTVAADKKLYKCLVKGSLGMNIFSTITAGIAMILLSIDLAIEISRFFYCQNYDCFQIESLYQTRSRGITGVLLVLSILEFIISICVSVFACRAVCDNSSEPAVFIQTQQAPINTVTQGYPQNPTVNTHPAVFIQTQQAPINTVTQGYPQNPTVNTHDIIHGPNVGQGVLNNSDLINIYSEPMPSKLL